MKQKLFLLGICLLSGSAFATPATGVKTCTFTYNGTNWSISIPTDTHGIQTMNGDLEQMAQIANNLVQARICVF